MKAADLFKQRGKPAPSLPVKFKLVSEVESVQEIRDAEAVFRFVPDRLKTDADADAAKELAALSAKGVPISDEIRLAYQQAHFLHAAMRDAQAPATVFFDGATEARSMLMPSERMQLLARYQGWIEREFTTDWTSPGFKEAMADAESFSPRALLTKYGYDITRLCVNFLAMTPTTPPTT